MTQTIRTIKPLSKRLLVEHDIKVIRTHNDRYDIIGSTATFNTNVLTVFDPMFIVPQYIKPPKDPTQIDDDDEDDDDGNVVPLSQIETVFVPYCRTSAQNIGFAFKQESIVFAVPPNKEVLKLYMINLVGLRAKLYGSKAATN